MSTSGTPTGVMRFKMEVMKKDNFFTTITPPNVNKISVKGIYHPDDTIHQPGYIRYIDVNGNEVLVEGITTGSGIITIDAVRVIESRGINLSHYPDEYPE